MNKIFSRRGMIFLALFTILTLIGIQIDVFSIMGEEGKAFTLFEFFGPMAGGFLGIGGLVVVGLAKLINFAMGGSEFSLIGLAKLTPMMFAAYYFWKKGIRGMNDKLGIIVPVIAMLAFWLHPVGSQVWFYPLYWLIPIAAKFLPENLLLRSFGATFTAHAVGSVLFLYTIPTAPALWMMLIPIVAIERSLFALGISASYVVFTNILDSMDKAFDVSKYLNIEKKYVLHL
jgi:hypothetical protein